MNRAEFLDSHFSRIASSPRRHATQLAATVGRLAVGLVVVLSSSAAAAVSLETVPIGNPGNAADDTGYGAVGYEYRMGATEVTNAQYVEFLNAVAASDPYELFHDRPTLSNIYGIVRTGSPGGYSYSVKPTVAGAGFAGTDYAYDDKPVNYVSFYSALRFANWIHNGQGNGDTETGAYTLLGGTPTPTNVVTRNPGARWFVPSEDEWYKAAYFDPASGQYADYATGADTVPDNNPPMGNAGGRPPTGDTGNSANYDFATSNPTYPFTNVGAYALSASPYGTFDQNGNVAEFVDSPLTSGGSPRVVRGGSAFDSGMSLPATVRAAALPDLGLAGLGFRLAAIPEPSGGALAGVIAVVAWLARRRRS